MPRTRNMQQQNYQDFHRPYNLCYHKVNKTLYEALPCTNNKSEIVQVESNIYTAVIDTNGALC